MLSLLSVCAYDSFVHCTLQVLGVLGGPDDQRAVENELVLSLGFEHFELIKELIKNRWVATWTRAGFGARGLTWLDAKAG